MSAGRSIAGESTPSLIDLVVARIGLDQVDALELVVKTFWRGRFERKEDGTSAVYCPDLLDEGEAWSQLCSDDAESRRDAVSWWIDKDRLFKAAESRQLLPDGTDGLLEGKPDFGRLADLEIRQWPERVWWPFYRSWRIDPQVGEPWIAELEVAKARQPQVVKERGRQVAITRIERRRGRGAAVLLMQGRLPLDAVALLADGLGGSDARKAALLGAAAAGTLATTMRASGEGSTIPMISMVAFTAYTRTAAGRWATRLADDWCTLVSGTDDPSAAPADPRGVKPGRKPLKVMLPDAVNALVAEGLVTPGAHGAQAEAASLIKKRYLLPHSEQTIAHDIRELGVLQSSRRKNQSGL